MLTRQEIISFFASRGLKPNKMAGENFIVSDMIQAKLVSFCALDNRKVIEIGAGLGQASESLAKKAKEIFLIEINPRYCNYLSLLFGDNPKVHIINEDILKVKFNRLIGEGETAQIYGNIPYNISSDIIFHLIDNGSSVDTVYLMLQSEVCERIASKPGTKEYGRLSVNVQRKCEVKLLYNIPKEAFFPIPKVQSGFISLKFLKNSPISNMNDKIFKSLTRAAFGQRRKIIANALQKFDFISLNKSDILKICELANVSSNLRAEEIDIDGFIRLTNAIENTCSKNA